MTLRHFYSINGPFGFDTENFIGTDGDGDTINIDQSGPIFPTRSSASGYVAKNLDVDEFICDWNDIFNIVNNNPKQLGGFQWTEGGNTTLGFPELLPNIDVINAPLKLQNAPWRTTNAGNGQYYIEIANILAVNDDFGGKWVVTVDVDLREVIHGRTNDEPNSGTKLSYREGGYDNRVERAIYCETFNGLSDDGKQFFVDGDASKFFTTGAANKLYRFAGYVPVIYEANPFNIVYRDERGAIPIQEKITIRSKSLITGFTGVNEGLAWSVFQGPSHLCSPQFYGTHFIYDGHGILTDNTQTTEAYINFCGANDGSITDFQSSRAAPQFYSCQFDVTKLTTGIVNIGSHNLIMDGMKFDLSFSTGTVFFPMAQTFAPKNLDIHFPRSDWMSRSRMQCEINQVNADYSLNTYLFDGLATPNVATENKDNTGTVRSIDPLRGLIVIDPKEIPDVPFVTTVDTEIPTSGYQVNPWLLGTRGVSSSTATASQLCSSTVLTMGRIQLNFPSAGWRVRVKKVKSVEYEQTTLDSRPITYRGQVRAGNGAGAQGSNGGLKPVKDSTWNYTGAFLPDNANPLNYDYQPAGIKNLQVLANVNSFGFYKKATVGDIPVYYGLDSDVFTETTVNLAVPAMINLLDEEPRSSSQNWLFFDYEIQCQKDGEQTETYYMGYSPDSYGGNDITQPGNFAWNFGRGGRETIEVNEAQDDFFSQVESIDSDKTPASQTQELYDEIQAFAWERDSDTAYNISRIYSPPLVHQKGRDGLPYLIPESLKLTDTTSADRQVTQSNDKNTLIVRCSGDIVGTRSANVEGFSVDSSIDLSEVSVGMTDCRFSAQYFHMPATTETNIVNCSFERFILIDNWNAELGNKAANSFSSTETASDINLVGVTASETYNQYELFGEGMTVGENTVITLNAPNLGQDQTIYAQVVDLTKWKAGNGVTLQSLTENTTVIVPAEQPTGTVLVWDIEKNAVATDGAGVALKGVHTVGVATNLVVTNTENASADNFLAYYLPAPANSTVYRTSSLQFSNFGGAKQLLLLAEALDKQDYAGALASETTAYLEVKLDVPTSGNAIAQYTIFNPDRQELTRPQTQALFFTAYAIPDGTTTKATADVYLETLARARLTYDIISPYTTANTTNLNWNFISLNSDSSEGVPIIDGVYGVGTQNVASADVTRNGVAVTMTSVIIVNDYESTGGITNQEFQSEMDGRQLTAANVGNIGLSVPAYDKSTNKLIVTPTLPTT